MVECSECGASVKKSYLRPGRTYCKTCSAKRGPGPYVVKFVCSMCSRVKPARQFVPAPPTAPGADGLQTRLCYVCDSKTAKVAGMPLAMVYARLDAHVAAERRMADAKLAMDLVRAEQLKHMCNCTGCFRADLGLEIDENTGKPFCPLCYPSVHITGGCRTHWTAPPNPELHHRMWNEVVEGLPLPPGALNEHLARMSPPRPTAGPPAEAPVIHIPLASDTEPM